MDVLREALAAVRAIQEEEMVAWARLAAYRRVKALADLALHLPDALRGKDSASRVLTLARLAPHLPMPLKNNTIEESWTLARSHENKRKQCQVFAALLPYLTASLKQAVLQETLTLTRSLHRIERSEWESLVRLTPYLAEPLRSEVLREVLAGISMIRDDMDEHEAHEQVRSVWEAIEHHAEQRYSSGIDPPTPQPLTEEQLPGALAAARMIEESPQEDLAYFLLFSGEGGTELRAEALVWLVPPL